MLVAAALAWAGSPALAGPALAGPALAGPALAGPALAGPALADPAQADLARGGTACPEVRLTSDLPAPPAGAQVRQSITIGDDCVAHPGPVEVVAAPRSLARVGAREQAEQAAASAEQAAATPRTLHSYSQMYDCCNILMTALYSDHTWSTADGLVSAADSRVSTHANREPWDAGWTAHDVTGAGGCAAACPTATYTARAGFSYRGIFDVTGAWYANTHDSTVVLTGDGAATCRHSVDLRHTFVGWHWEHGCS
ncbi:hypothetical protein KRMM14A1259_11440 [Krasilnikovia sp. MM14-A1259]